MRLRSHTVFVALFAPAVLAADAGWLDGLDGYVEKTRSEWQVPGLALVVVQDDTVVLARGFGVRDVDGVATVDERTLFAIGSASKAFTAAAIALLAADGTLGFDDRVIDHLPQFRLHDPYATREMTVRDLLCHRSGLARGDLLWYGSPFSRQEVLERVRWLEPSWSFRAQFGYQNIMYLAAGLVLEARAGQSWDAFVDARIFTPLGMDASNTSTTALAGLPNVAAPHAELDEVPRRIPWRNIDNVAPAGSINSNVVELAQWIRLQLGRGSIDGRQIIPAELVDEMHTPQAVVRNEGRWRLSFPASDFTSYGLGWFVNDYRGKKVVEHGGSIDGMRALVSLMPSEKLGLAVLTNLGGSFAPEAVRYRIFDLWLGAADRDWSAELLEQSRAVELTAAEEREQRAALREDGTRPSLVLDRYTGTYTHAMYPDVVVAHADGRLQLAFGTAFRGPLEHWQHDTFRVAWDDRTLGQAWVTFALDADGRVADVAIEDVATFDPKTPHSREETHAP